MYHHGREGFLKCKAPSSCSSATSSPSPYAEFFLATDASDSHIGSVRQQKTGDHWHPLGFISKKLPKKESRYSTFDQELLAAYFSICHFREGCLFQLWTDHKLLVTALSRVTALILPLQQRHLAFITEFNMQMLTCLVFKRLSLIFCHALRCHPSRLGMSPPARRQCGDGC